MNAPVDNPRGGIASTYFYKEEALQDYYNTLHQIFTWHGIPYMFYTGRRTIFEYKKISAGVKADILTQFSYSSKHLGMEDITAFLSQSKGRVDQCLLANRK